MYFNFQFISLAISNVDFFCKHFIWFSVNYFLKKKECSEDWWRDIMFSWTAWFKNKAQGILIIIIRHITEQFWSTTLTTGFTPSLYKYLEVRSYTKGFRANICWGLRLYCLDFFVNFFIAKTRQEAVLVESPCGTQSFR